MIWATIPDIMSGKQVSISINKLKVREAKTVAVELNQRRKFHFKTMRSTCSPWVYVALLRKICLHYMKRSSIFRFIQKCLQFCACNDPNCLKGAVLVSGYRQMQQTLK